MAEFEERLRERAVHARKYPLRWTDRPDVPGPSFVFMDTDEVDRITDLVAAVRKERRLMHRMDAYSSRDLRGNPPTIVTTAMEHDAAEQAVEAALAALDEAGRG